MTMHIKFTDGSNPWLTFGSKDHIKKQWTRWAKACPSTARPKIYGSALECAYGVGGWFVAVHIDGAHTGRTFARLGDALNYMEREEARA